jgi:hypothetical protein
VRALAILVLLSSSTTYAQQVAGDPDAQPQSAAVYLGSSSGRTGAVATDEPVGTTRAIARGVATIEPVREQVAVRRERKDNHDMPGQGPLFTYGRAGQRGGPSGYLLRYDFEMMPVYPGHDEDGGVVAYYVGYEWSRLGPDNWSFAMPLTWAFGMRTQPVRATVGFGLDLVVIDQVNDDTGVGFFAPFANARLGVDVKGFQLGVDARYGYHWQIGADDHARWQLGAFVGKTFEGKRPVY